MNALKACVVEAYRALDLVDESTTDTPANHGDAVIVSKRALRELTQTVRKAIGEHETAIRALSKKAGIDDQYR